MNIKALFNLFFSDKKYIYYAFMIAGLYLFFLITNLPARFVLSVINLPADIKLSSVSGTIWSAKVKNFQYKSIELGSVKWELHPLNLLSGSVSADVSIINNKQYINTEVSFTASGKIELEETRFLIELSSFQPLTYGMPFAYDGKVSGYFPVSYILMNEYVALNGKLSLNSLKLISPQQQLFGDFVIDFRAEKEGQTSGQIKDTGGPLSMEGQLTLNKSGILNLSAKMAAREAGNSLDNMLALFGRKDGSGRIQLNHKFKLWH